MRSEITKRRRDRKATFVKKAALFIVAKGPSGSARRVSNDPETNHFRSLQSQRNRQSGRVRALILHNLTFPVPRYACASLPHVPVADWKCSFTIRRLNQRTRTPLSEEVFPTLVAQLECHESISTNISCLSPKTSTESLTIGRLGNGV